MVFSKRNIENIIGDYDKYADNFPNIRLIYVNVNKHKGYDLTSKVGVSFIVSSVFAIPEGMTILDACKIVSYLSEKIEKEKGIEPASDESVALVADTLKDYNFEMLNDVSYSHYHQYGELGPFSKICTKFDEPEYGTTDLFTVEAEEKVFKKTNLVKRYFNWFVEGVTKDDINKIYAKANLDFPESSQKR